MNLKDLFRKKNIVNLKDTTNVKEKELIRKISRVGNIRLKLTAKSKFKLSENWGAVPPTITFELVDYPGHVMRARSLELFGEKKRDDESFANSSSFFKMPNLWFNGFVSFESSMIAGHYIRLHGNELTLGRYDGSELFKEECSFRMTSDGKIYDEESKYRNDWITDEAGIGLLVNHSKKFDEKMDGRLILVPQEINKLPGLSPVMYPRRKDLCNKKQNETGRSKKLVTFNKTEFVYENESHRLENGMRNSVYEISTLNVVEEQNEMETSNNERSISTLELNGKDDEIKSMFDSSKLECKSFMLRRDSELKTSDPCDWNIRNGIGQSARRSRKKGVGLVSNHVESLLERMNEREDGKDKNCCVLKSGSALNDAKMGESCHSDDDDEDDDDDDDDDDDNDHQGEEDAEDNNDHSSDNDHSDDAIIVGDDCSNIIGGHIDKESTVLETHGVFATQARKDSQEVKRHVKLNGKLKDASDEHVAGKNANSEMIFDSDVEQWTCGARGECEKERKDQRHFVETDNFGKNIWCKEKKQSNVLSNFKKGVEVYTTVSRPTDYCWNKDDLDSQPLFYPSLNSRQGEVSRHEISTSIDNIHENCTSESETVLVCLADEPFSCEERRELRSDWRFGSLTVSEEEKVESRLEIESGLEVESYRGELTTKRMKKWYPI